MSNPVIRLAAGLAASGLALSTAPASAALPPPGGGTTNPCATYTYTLQGCQTPVTSCDQAARELAKTNADALCNQLIQNEANTQAALMPQRTVLVPSMTRADGSTVAPEATTKTVASRPANPNSLSMGGLGSFYLGQVQRAQTYLPATGPYTDYLNTQRALQRNTWNANGNVIDSCNEYVFEKYYDYSVFEDKAVTYGTNHRAIFNTAFATGRGTTYAIGTRALTDPLQRGKDGTPFNPPITLPSNQPKNQFFTVPLAQPGSKVVIAQGTADNVAVLPGNGGVLIWLKSLQRPLNLNGVSFVDTNLVPTLTQGASYYDESWAWHQQMAQRNAGVLDEEMYRMEQLQSDFTALVRKREETAGTIASMFNSQPLPTPVPIFEREWWRDLSWTPDPVLVTQYAQLDVNVMDSSPVGFSGARTSASSSLPSMGMAIDPSPDTAIALPAYASALNSTRVLTACGGNTIVCLLYKLEALDAAIEDALHQAQSLGCLTFNTSGPAVCDWSPKRFSQRVMSLYQGDREKAYQQCMNYTDDDFSSLRNLSMVVPGGVNFPAQDYTTSPTRLEQYITRRDQYLASLKKTLPNLMDPVTGKARLKWESGESYNMGNDTFGATANYTVGFELANLGANECAATPHAYGSFDATGRALGKSVNLVHANASVTNTHADVDLDVFDNSVHVVELHKDLPVGQFNVVSGSKSYSKTFVDVHANFVIVVVPVKLGAKLGGTVGLNYAMNVNHNVTQQTNGCHISSVGVGGTLEPFAAVDGELYAAVDIFIASAGVKGKIQLVHAGVPLNASAALTYGKNGQSLVTLDMATRADLRFTFMSGSIAAYAEVGICPFCEDFDATLVSWDGLHYDLPLFSQKLSVPLGDLQALVAASH